MSSPAVLLGTGEPHSPGYPFPVLAPTLIIIPAHNEQEAIGKVLEDLRATAIVVDVLVIDDGSTDDTAAEARRHGASVVSHAFNLGYGATLLTGYRYACKQGYERIVQMDSDGQHDPGSVRDLLAALDQGADVAIGSRYLTGTPPPTSFARKVGTSLFAGIASFWTRSRITDPSSGFQAIRANALTALTHDGFPEDFPDANTLIGLSREGFELVEVPVTMHPRSTGTSMFGSHRVLYYGYKMFLSLFLLPIRRRSPYRAERMSAMNMRAR